MGLIRGLPVLAAALAALALVSCGDPNQTQPGRPVATLTDPAVAARVNGKPIYNDDVIAEAISRGAIKEGEDLDPTSPLFYQITEDLIETRLFAIEAEARGLDKDADVRHRLDTARERILANVLNENIANTALKESAIERMYREQVKLLKQGQQVRISDILLDLKEDALAAKRRLDQGESFVSLAYELSKDRVSGPEGGEIGWRALDALPDAIKNAINVTDVGKVTGPVNTPEGWRLIKVDEKRDATPPSLESMRPQIVQWLMFDEQRRVVDKLKATAHIALNENAPAGAGVTPPPGLAAPAARPDTDSLGSPAAGANLGPRLGPGGQASAPISSAPPAVVSAAPPASSATPATKPASSAKPASSSTPATSSSKPVASAAKPKPPVVSGAPPAVGERDL